MLEQVSSGLFLAARAVVESLSSLKMPGNDFGRCCLCWNSRTSCLSWGQPIVLTRIPCDLSSPLPMAVTGVLSVSGGRQEGEVTAAASALPAWGGLRWQGHLGQGWISPVCPPRCCQARSCLGAAQHPPGFRVPLLPSFVLLLGVAFSPKLTGQIKCKSNFQRENAPRSKACWHGIAANCDSGFDLSAEFMCSLVVYGSVLPLEVKG